MSDLISNLGGKSLNMRLIATIIILLTATCSYAQFGKLLKEKAKNLASQDNINKLKGLAGDKLNEARAEMDSTSFSFAISVNDNADFFDTDTGSDKVLKAFTNLQTNEESTEEEKARRLLDAGELAYAKGYYNKAEVLLTSAMLKYEANSISGVNYLTTISDLGLLYGTMGRYAKSEEFNLKALEKRKEELGEKSAGYGASLNNLAVLQKETGRYNEAEKNAKKAVEVLRAASGEESMPLAIALNNEAMLYQAVGRYEQADEILKNAIAISKELQSEKSNNHQKFLSNQAFLYQEMGKYEQSEEIYNELIRVKERRLGSNHPDYAHTISNLASLYIQMGKVDKVEELLKGASDIYKKKFGDEHSLYASSLSDLGNFYRFSKRYNEAKPLIKESLEIKLKALGKDHPEYVQGKEDMAIVEWKLGNIAEAKKLYLETLNQSLDFINEYFPPMSESEKTKYWDKLRPRFERFYSFAFDQGESDKALVKDAYEHHIATKGLLLNSTNKIKSKILNSGDQALVDEYLLWIDQKQTLAQYYAYSKEELEEQNINRDSLESATNQSEKRLSEKSDLFSEGYQLKQVTFEEVNAKLKEGQGAIELVRYRYFDNTWTDEVYYAALVLSSTTSVPDVAILKNGAHLETRYFKYYNNVIHQKLEDTYSYDQYWAAISPLVNGKRTLFVSTDGIYNQINLNTLSKDGKSLLEQYDIQYLGSTKNLGSSASSAAAKNSFLIGNPTFGGSEIAPLPGTKSELLAVSKLMTSNGYKISQYLAADATEVNIKKVDNPAILHIATHGYFLQDVEGNKEKVFGISAESAKNNPLLRSGLLLANAGVVADQMASLNDSNNGVLTAYEATNLKLDNTNLVVLSACETAVGDVKAGEGVYGLQRAFLSAGAKSLLMSLWKVSDEATQELMTSFYANWLKSGNRQKAFKQAQLSLKSKYKDPYFWGAFVLVEN